MMAVAKKDDELPQSLGENKALLGCLSKNASEEYIGSFVYLL